MSQSGPTLGIYYEHPDWYRPLFDELDRRGVAYEKLHADAHRYDPAGTQSPYAIVFNRMSPSAYTRGRGDAIFYTSQYLAHLDRLGVRVINGSAAWRTEISKAYQITLFERLGVPYPKARVIHRGGQAAEAADGLRFPVIVKPNIGGSGAGIRRFDTIEQLARAAREDALQLGIDSTALVQEYVPADCRTDRSCGGPQRPVSVRHPHLHARRQLQSLSGGRLPERGRRRAGQRRRARLTRRRISCASKGIRRRTTSSTPWSASCRRRALKSAAWST